MSKINFSTMTADQLWDFWRNYHRADKRSCFAVCGKLGEGTKLATESACNYAANKSTAMRCRAVGRIEEAEMYESICESIKADLPETIIA